MHGASVLTFQKMASEVYHVFQCAAALGADSGNAVKEGFRKAGFRRGGRGGLRPKKRRGYNGGHREVYSFSVMPGVVSATARLHLIYIVIVPQKTAK